MQKPPKGCPLTRQRGGVHGLLFACLLDCRVDCTLRGIGNKYKTIAQDAWSSFRCVPRVQQCVIISDPGEFVRQGIQKKVGRTQNPLPGQKPGQTSKEGHGGGGASKCPTNDFCRVVAAAGDTRHCDLPRNTLNALHKGPQQLCLQRDTILFGQPNLSSPAK